VNTGTIGLWSALGIGGVTLWRISGNKQPKGKQRDASVVKQAWSGFAMVLIVSFVTDFDAQLGSLFGLAVLMGLAYGGRGSPAGAFSGFLAKIGFLPSSSGGPLGPTAPTGTPRQGPGGPGGGTAPPGVRGPVH
jgi:hypothetical protein